MRNKDVARGDRASRSKFSLKILDERAFGSESLSSQFVSTCSTGGIYG